ncbi:hypothetical protein PybrP1_010622, partial [[Pythium] brassicae (nom. inval.)]
MQPALATAESTPTVSFDDSSAV